MGFLNLEKAFHDELTGKIMVVMLFLIFFLVAFVLFLHLYTKCYIQHSPPSPATATTTVSTRRRRLDFSPGYHLESISAVRSGLDPTVLESIPILSFCPEEHEKMAECAVCLSELSEGDKFRVLPKCHHGFHVDCIDMWFQFHSTCPLCRNPIMNPSQITKLNSEMSLDSILEAARAENTAFPTNVLVWGNQEQVSIRTVSNTDEVDEETTTVTIGGATLSPLSGMVVIDMPQQVIEMEEEHAGTVTTRMRSLRRLLSRDKRVNPCSHSGDATEE